MWLHFLHNYYHARWLMLPAISIPIEYMLSAANGCTRSYRFRLTESTHMNEHIKFHNLDRISFCSITLDAYVHTINIMIAINLLAIFSQQINSNSSKSWCDNFNLCACVCAFFSPSFRLYSWLMEKQYKTIRYIRLILIGPTWIHQKKKKFEMDDDCRNSNNKIIYNDIVLRWDSENTSSIQ